MKQEVTTLSSFKVSAQKFQNCPRNGRSQSEGILVDMSAVGLRFPFGGTAHRVR